VGACETWALNCRRATDRQPLDVSEVPSTEPSRSLTASYIVDPVGRVLVAETAIQFLERWRQAHVYAELRVPEQLDETVAECIGAAAEDDIPAGDLEKAAGGSLKEYLRMAIINTSE
jgi:hypothetical protein